MAEESSVKKLAVKNELGDATSAPTILTIGDVECVCWPLDLTSMSLLRAWAKQRIMDETRENIKLLDGVSEELVKRSWDEAYEYLKDPLVSPAMECPEAVAYWMYLSIKRGDALITEVAVTQLLGQADMKSLLATLMQLNGVAPDELGNVLAAAATRKR